MLSELTFGSYLTYDPKPKSEAARDAYQWMQLIKFDKVIRFKGETEWKPTSIQLAGRLRAVLKSSGLDAVLDPSCILVPVPRCSLQRTGSLWPAKNMVAAMLAVGIGSRMCTCLKRAKAVPKSAWAKPGERPTPKTHYESFEVEEADLTETGRIVLVDDLITKGATIIAGASKIKDAFPNSEIAGFAMMRTVGYRTDFRALADPTIGTITVNKWGNASREP
jgi:hypothetical protein